MVFLYLQCHIVELEGNCRETGKARRCRDPLQSIAQQEDLKLEY
jgi:hypothetical protein